VLAAIKVLVAKPGLAITLEHLIRDGHIHAPAVEKISFMLADAAENYRSSRCAAVAVKIATPLFAAKIGTSEA
jgi:hypothetical protein